MIDLLSRGNKDEAEEVNSFLVVPSVAITNSALLLHRYNYIHQALRASSEKPALL
jgi:hypothetical protein